MLRKGASVKLLWQRNERVRFGEEIFWFEIFSDWDQDGFVFLGELFICTFMLRFWNSVSDRMNKTSRKRPRKQNLCSRPRKTSTFKLAWPWIVPAAAVHHAASAFFFWGPKVKTCQRIRVKCFQSVGFRSSIDFNFSRQLFLVTTHSRFGVFFGSNGQSRQIIT